MKKKKHYKLFRPINDKFVNKIIKRDIALYIVLVISLIMVTTSSTYAFIQTEVDNITIENIVSSTVEGVEVEKNQINISNLNPSTEAEVLSSLPSCKIGEKEVCSMYEFTVDNTNTEVAKNIKYSLTNINNGFSNLKFKVYKGKQSTITSSSTSLMNSDKLNPNISNIELTGLDSTIKAKEEITYTMVFYLEETDNQELYDGNKEFNANILIDLKTSGYAGE